MSTREQMLALVAKWPHDQHTVWKDGIDVEYCNSDCRRCQVERALAAPSAPTHEQDRWIGCPFCARYSAKFQELGLPDPNMFTSATPPAPQPVRKSLVCATCGRSWGYCDHTVNKPQAAPEQWDASAFALKEAKTTLLNYECEKWLPIVERAYAAGAASVRPITAEIVREWSSRLGELGCIVWKWNEAWGKELQDISAEMRHALLDAAAQRGEK